MPESPAQHESTEPSRISGAKEAANSCAGCVLSLACLLLPPITLPIVARVHERFLGPVLWLALCVALLALWLWLADSPIHGFVWGAVYVAIVLMLGVQILMALAMLLGHVFVYGCGKTSLRS